MLRNRWLWLAVLVLAAFSFGWFRMRGKTEEPKYRTAAVERGALRATVSATGTVKPVTQVEVGSQVSGTVSRVLADFNSRVHAGQVLCQIDPSSFEARLAQAEASVARAQAALQEAERQYKRSQELVRDNYVSQADVETAESNVAQRRADLQQARAQLQVARVDLQNSTIRSPIEGVVISRSIDVGQTVAASLQAPKLFVIANDLARMQVETNIDEADIGRIHVGQPVEFTVDAFADATFEGEVSQVRLEPITQQNVVTYTTVIQTRNDDLRLRPGMTANVSVITDTRADVMKVPNAALRFRPPNARGGAGGPNGAGGRGSGGNGGAPGPRRSFALAWPSLIGDAHAQTPPGERRDVPPGGPPVLDDPFVRETRARVERGEITREQARELIRKHFEDLGLPPPGAPGAPPRPDGAGAPPAPGEPRGVRGERPERASARAAQGAVRGDAADAAPRGERGVASKSPSELEPGALKPGTVYVLRGGKPVPVPVRTGISDGTATEVVSDELKAGDLVVVGTEQPANAQNRNLQPPPGMGGPQFRGPGGGGRR